MVAEAARCGITVMALTDHDTCEGLPAAQAAAQCHGLEFIPGVEVSVNHPTGGELHVLGYGLDPSDAALADGMARNRAERDRRVPRMLEALAAAGMPLDADEVRASAKGSVGRPHVADALVRAGHVRSRQEAFDRYLGDGRGACVPKQNLPADEAIALIHGAGGVAVLAHPSRRWSPAVMEALVRSGLDGFEAWHPSNSDSQARQLVDMAARWSLIVTGGSDCHGDREGQSIMRSHHVPASAAAAVLDRAAVRARAGGR